MDIEEFYSADERRRQSVEVEFGNNWFDAGATVTSSAGSRTPASSTPCSSWPPRPAPGRRSATSRSRTPRSTPWSSPCSPSIPTREAVEQLLDGWAEPHGRARRRALGGRAAPGRRHRPTGAGLSGTGTWRSMVDLPSGLVGLDGWSDAASLVVQRRQRPGRSGVTTCPSWRLGTVLERCRGDAVDPARRRPDPPTGPARRWPRWRPPTEGNEPRTTGGTSASPACWTTPRRRVGSMTKGPSGPTSSGGMPDAVLVRGVDGRPGLLPAPGRGGRGGRLRLDGRARQPLLSRGVGLDLSVQPGRLPRVPRRTSRSSSRSRSSRPWAR